MALRHGLRMGERGEEPAHGLGAVAALVGDLPQAHARLEGLRVHVQQTSVETPGGLQLSGIQRRLGDRQDGAHHRRHLEVLVRPRHERACRDQRAKRGACGDCEGARHSETPARTSR